MLMSIDITVEVEVVCFSMLVIEILSKSIGHTSS